MRDPDSLKNLVQTAMDAILVRHDRAEVRRHFHPDFVQHNPWAEDGGAHVEAMCDFNFGVEMSRWVVQGDIVAYHGLYSAPNPLGDLPLVCVDLWRVQGSQIVEHWDALEPLPPEQAEAVLRGRGDGLSAISPARVAAHAASARRLIELGVNRQDPEALAAALAPGFSVHLPDAEPGHGRDALLRWVQKEKPTVTVKRTVSSGDLVLLQLLVEASAKEQVVYDIFRFDAAGKITDEWRVTQDRLPISEAANPHPHF